MAMRGDLTVGGALEQRGVHERGDPFSLALRLFHSSFCSLFSPASHPRAFGNLPSDGPTLPS
jgi:hypothetical protein